jgi:hypothetical protein
LQFAEERLRALLSQEKDSEEAGKGAGEQER